MSLLRLTPTEDGHLELRITRYKLRSHSDSTNVATISISPDEVEDIRDACEEWLELTSQKIMMEGMGIQADDEN